MTIHARRSSVDEDADTDCEKTQIIPLLSCSFASADFYNYLQHGIDFLISGTTHTVKKVILHTNIVRMLNPVSLTLLSLLH